MHDFDPPSIAPNAAPEFTDASGCAKWLQTLPLINVGPSHGRLLGQLEELNACNIAPAERLKILELLREPASFVQKEHSKKFSNRPAPLAKPEREIFANVNALWDALSHGYRHCLQAIAGGASGVNVALACQRVLWCTGQKMVALYQAYQDVAERDWRLLHRVYAFAEERDVAEDEVAHPAHKGKETTCVETYAQVLLVNLATPSKLTPRQIELISRWLERWARKVAIGRTPSAAEGGVPPLVVDLAGSVGASHGAAQGEAIRYLEIQDVGKSVRKRVGLLRKGETPTALGLGEDITASLAEGLLVMLYRRWCEENQLRTHPRHGASGTAQIGSGMEAIHYFVTGRTFKPPSAYAALSQRQHDEIATLGRVATHLDNETSAPPGFALETWQIKDESASGLRLERSDTPESSRLVLNQLLAIRLADAKHFLLCAVRWMSVSANFELRIGVQIFPGVPLGVAIRPAGTAEKHALAFLLPAVAALKTPDTLIIPAGWFKPKRPIELLTDSARQLQLAAVIDRGADFERVTFEAV